MSLIKYVNFSQLGDDRGGLISLESGINIPFDIKRVYYIYGTKIGVSRGYHAHKALKQIAVCVSGQCRFILDDGHSREETVLDSPDKGILIEDMIWREMQEFSEDCVLLVLASEHYDEEDYIRDYQVFIEQVRL